MGLLGALGSLATRLVAFLVAFVALVAFPVFDFLAATALAGAAAFVVRTFPAAVPAFSLPLDAIRGICVQGRVSNN